MSNLFDYKPEGAVWHEEAQLFFPHFLPFMKMVFSEVGQVGKYTDKDALTFATEWFTEARIFLVQHPEALETSLDREAPLDLPFEICYFEIPGQNFKIEVIDQSQVETTNTIVLDRPIELCWMLVVDKSGVTSIFAYGYAKGDAAPKFYSYLESDEPDSKERLENGFLKSLTRSILAQMKAGTVATEYVNIKQKARHHGENIHHRIKEVIHIVPRKNFPIKCVSEGGSVDWSHRWEVMGHWRKITGPLGKNRHGEYVVSGYTWVNSHERGPDNKPLVKKVRVTPRENII